MIDFNYSNIISVGIFLLDKSNRKGLFFAMSKIRSHHSIIKLVKISFTALMCIMIISSYFPFSAYSSDHLPGKLYFVATNGSDSNPGTVDRPWKTIQKAADTLKAGETVQVRGGVYEEFITVRSSGSAAAGYITFQSYPGEQAVIDAKNLKISSAKNSLFHLKGANYIVIEGFEIRNLISSSSSEYPAGIKVQSGGSNIHIISNDIHHIENRHAKGNAHGIIIYGDRSVAISNVTIADNKVHDLILGSSESVTVSGNVDGFSIVNNEVYNNNNIGIDIAGHYNACSHPCKDQARNGVVAFNHVYNIDTGNNSSYDTKCAAGIYVDGGQNILIEFNQVHHSNFGVSISSENKGKYASEVILRNNIIHHNEGAGIVLGGSSASKGGTKGSLITNNTFYYNDTLRQGYGEITFQNHNENVMIVNNILYALSGKLFLQKTPKNGNGMIVDYNMYYRDDNVNAISWKWEEKSFKTWDEYRKGTGFDTNSIFADPSFTDVEAYQFTLNNDSAAIDAGTSQYSYSGDVDYYQKLRVAGHGIDLGASEYIVESEVEHVITPEPTKSPEATIDPEATTGPEPTSTFEPVQTPEPTSVVQPGSDPNASGKVKIMIDGLADDWNEVPILATSSSNVRELKAVVIDRVLYVLVKGNVLNEKGQLYIETTAKQGISFNASQWKESNISYLIENGLLYEYSGSGKSNWKWTHLNFYKGDSMYKNTSTIVEYAIPLDYIGGDSEQIKVAYLWKDSSTNKLPLSSTMAEVSKIEGLTPIQPEKDPSFNDQDVNITIDGNSSDWLEIDAIITDSSDIKTMKIFNDTAYLYMLLEGSKLKGKVQIYMNADMDENTGYRKSNWSSAGIDYLLEGGILYRYNGNGSNWSFVEVVNLMKTKRYVSTTNTIELAIPLDQIENLSDQLKLGVMFDDNKSKMLSSDKDLITYSMK